MSLEHIILQSVPAAITKIVVEEKGPIITFKQDKLKILSNFLKYSSLTTFNSLLDVWATDNLQNLRKRFTLYYMLLSYKKNIRVYLKSSIPMYKNLAKANSITATYSSAGFLEREVWDLFGIFFLSHPDLRRIVTDYGFKGFPLRKDFPVTGFKEVKYDDESAKLIYEPVKFSQAYRLYSFQTPWSINTTK